jgi:hypothetical protein
MDDGLVLAIGLPCDKRRKENVDKKRLLTISLLVSSGSREANTVDDSIYIGDQPPEGVRLGQRTRCR